MFIYFNMASLIMQENAQSTMLKFIKILILNWIEDGTREVSNFNRIGHLLKHIRSLFRFTARASCQNLLFVLQVPVPQLNLDITHRQMFKCLND